MEIRVLQTGEFLVSRAFTTRYIVFLTAWSTYFIKKKRTFSTSRQTPLRRRANYARSFYRLLYSDKRDPIVIYVFIKISPSANSTFLSLSLSLAQQA